MIRKPKFSATKVRLFDDKLALMRLRARCEKEVKDKKAKEDVAIALKAKKVAAVTKCVFCSAAQKKGLSQRSYTLTPASSSVKSTTSFQSTTTIKSRAVDVGF